MICEEFKPFLLAACFPCDQFAYSPSLFFAIFAIFAIASSPDWSSNISSPEFCSPSILDVIDHKFIQLKLDIPLNLIGLLLIKTQSVAPPEKTQGQISLFSCTIVSFLDYESV